MASKREEDISREQGTSYRRIKQSTQRWVVTGENLWFQEVTNRNLFDMERRWLS